MQLIPFWKKKKKINKKLVWARLDRTQKINKIYDYIDRYAIKHNISDKEKDELKTYLATAVDRKKLQKVSEIKYNKETCTVDDIPILIFNSINRKFTLKRNEKRSSTLNSLGSGTGKTRRRNLITKTLKDTEQS